MSYENLEKLDELRQKGVITDAEFQAEKSKILDRDQPGSRTLHWGMTEETFGMLLHLAAFLNFVVPFAGLVLQIVMWATNKKDSAVIDAHGKHALNWFISLFIYIIISAVLCFVLIGIPMLLTLAVLDLVFPIMAAVKANNGTVWRYPLSIRFLT